MELSRNHFQRNSTWNAPYNFSGKEKDVETGYGYFGARYYDSGLSIWLSVDPMSDKYPSMSPYNYCANNPVILVDPDGREIDLSLLYTKKSDGSNKYKFAVLAFEAFAKTEIGRRELGKYAKAKQTIAGYEYKSNGEYHNKGIDLILNGEVSVLGRSGETSQEIVGNRLKITVGFSNTEINNGSDIGDIVEPLIHEMLVHAYQLSEDFKIDKILNNSQASKVLVDHFSKYKNTKITNNIHHWQEIRHNKRMKTEGIDILNEIYKGSKSRDSLLEKVKINTKL